MKLASYVWSRDRVLLNLMSIYLDIPLTFSKHTILPANYWFVQCKYSNPKTPGREKTYRRPQANNPTTSQCSDKNRFKITQ